MTDTTTQTFQWHGVSTTNDFAGFKTVRVMGISLSQTYRFHDEAFNEMCRDAVQKGANAVIGMRFAYYMTESGTPAFFCYGTAVWVEPLESW